MGNASMREHYAALSKATGKVIAEPVLPAALVYLWNIFVMLSRGRGGNGFGPNPLSWPDIWSYCSLTGTRLSPWELEAITMLDDAYIAAAAKQADQ